MDEREFERDLELAFAQAQQSTADDLFAASVQRRLERAWGLRTAALAAAGVVGGSVALTQALGAGIGVRIQAASNAGIHATSTIYRKVLAETDMAAQFGGSANIFLVAAALFIVTAVVVSRALEDA